MGTSFLAKIRTFLQDWAGSPYQKVEEWRVSTGSSLCFVCFLSAYTKAGNR